ncbi:RNA polymerase sigma factor [Methylophaga sp. OBS4]|uniref:RNA polymerase sigma factor n=1 Tax=Methylophaga sp. OBS4 TaxID=2991935 RepID=UPI0022526FCE|nr:RNA polymerase sigma factor [Methylophaga sp. OBS4]MCX4188022.1 RNA polymerase sigma factor [Methylophaga sp. OBS4]
MNEYLDTLYQTDSRQILATLIRLLGDFELAEEAMHEAFAVALTKWPEQGIPDNPRAWLISTGRFKAIDQLRKQARFDHSLDTVADELAAEEPEVNDENIEDDRLRLIFTCCHPALSVEAQLALTLREVCGMTTEEVAHAFLIKPATVAQRIVRAKNKIRDAGIPYEVPEPSQFAERLQAVLQVIYLVFNEGYSASSGEALTRHDLSAEAIRLARLLMQLLPEAEVQGLLALLLLQDSRRTARTDQNGDLIVLEDQDRSLWNREQIREGCDLVLQALSSHQFGPFTLQAAIAAVHAEAPSSEKTDWPQIAGLYSALMQHTPSPIVALNHAVALAMYQGPEVGLQLIDELLSRGELQNYHLIYAARADLCRRLNRLDEARDAYKLALKLTQQGAEQRYLQHRIEELADKS